VILHFGPSERDPSIGSSSRHFGTGPDLRRHVYSGALQAAKTQLPRHGGRMIALWYERFLGRRYMRAAPRPGFVSLIAGMPDGLAIACGAIVVLLS